MAITRINPERLHETAGYAHVTIVEAGRLAVLAGQCPLDRNGRVVAPTDILAQVDQVVANAMAALAAAGAQPEQVIRSTVYVVSDDPGVLAALWKRLRTSAVGPALTSASTVIGVSALGYRDQLVELDLTATLP
jgi:enamine deaminase RidA (YjgF/YER057c/UK114 family)